MVQNSLVLDAKGKQGLGSKFVLFFMMRLNFHTCAANSVNRTYFVWYSAILTLRKKKKFSINLKVFLSGRELERVPLKELVEKDCIKIRTVISTNFHG
jgi:hypothetical protein